MSTSENINRLELLSTALGELKEKMVFTGGAVVELYAQSGGNPSPRITKDVDAIVHAVTLIEYNRFESELHSRGFVNAGLLGVTGPACRYVYQDIILDVMPTEEAVLGFSNRWFTLAMDNPIEYLLPSGSAIRLASFPRFLAIKLETLADRGGADIRGSHDLEDIVRLISSRTNPVAEIKGEVLAIREFIRDSVRKLLSKGMAREAIRAVAPQGPEQARIVYNVFEQLSFVFTDSNGTES